MSNFTLHTQLPKPAQAGVGRLSVSEKGEAHFFEGEASEHSKVLASMVRVRMEWAGADAIYLSGMEPDGVDRTGRTKYKHQEWLLKYLSN